MNKNHTGIIIVVIATALIIYAKFAKLIGYLNNFTFSNVGDGIQSYFNFSYYLRYGSGLTLEGINYPYGEHLHFINSHPLYLYIIDLFHVRDVAALEGVGIINFMMLLSIVISVPFIYLILREFKLPQWYAIIIAVIIQLNYPQFDRINGHFEFALAYILPMYWYFMIKYQKTSKPLLWAIFIMIYTIVICSISVYMAVFCSTFCIGIALVLTFQNRKNLVDIRNKAVPLFLIALLPLLLFLMFLEITDPVFDRPNNPWGFYEFNANPLSIFLPDTSIIKSILPARMYDYNWEGRAYVGLPATFLAIIMILYLCYKLIVDRKFDLKPFLGNSELNLYLAASTLILLYSMCWPFKWGLQFISDNLPLIKQFRALGRFAWIFYYVFSVYTAYQIYHFCKSLYVEKNSRFIAFCIMIFMLFQWAFDAGINLKKSNFDKIQPNVFLYRDDSKFLNALNQGGFSPSDFQAILALPFQQSNGDKMLFFRGPQAITQAMSYAYHTGIPLIQNITPRQSFDQSLSSIQLMANPCIEKARLSDMNSKPILLLTSKEKMRPVETEFLKSKKPFYSDAQVDLYAVPVSEFKEKHSICQNRYQRMLDTMTSGQPVLSSGNSNHVIHMGFDEELYKAPATFRGGGAFYLSKGEGIVFDIDLFNEGLKGTAEFSFWAHVDTRTYVMPEPYLEEIDKNDKVVWSKYIPIRETHDVHDLWIRGAHAFNIKPDHHYRLRVTGKYITLDDILIKPIMDEVIIRGDQINTFNNFPFEN